MVSVFYGYMQIIWLCNLYGYMQIVYGYAIFMFLIRFLRFVYGYVCAGFLLWFCVWLWFTAAFAYGYGYMAFAYGDVFCIMYGHFVSKCMAFAYGDAFCNFAITRTWLCNVYTINRM